MLFDKRVPEATRRNIAKVMLTPEKKKSLMAGIERGNQKLIEKSDIEVLRPKSFKDMVEKSDNSQSIGISLLGRMGSHSVGNQIVIPQPNILDKTKYPGKKLSILKKENEPVLLRHEVDENISKNRSNVFTIKHRHNSPEVIRREALNARAMSEADRLQAMKSRSSEIDTINKVVRGDKNIEIVSPRTGKVLNWISEMAQGSDYLKKNYPSAVLAAAETADRATKGIPVTAAERRRFSKMKNWTYA